MKKLLTLVLGISFVLAGVPLLIHSWCCMDPEGHCSNRYKVIVTAEGKKQEILVDRNGNGAARDEDGRCGNCHHAISAHTCTESGWAQ